MIVDRLENAERYYPLGDRLAAGLRYLRETDFAAVEPGRCDLDGDNLFALVEDYQTKPIVRGAFEAHRRYVDIQYVVSGVERIGWADVNDLAEAAPYDADKDFHKLAGEGGMLVVRAGTFVVLGPHDAHMPGIALDAPQPVRKIVVKAKIA